MQHDSLMIYCPNMKCRASNPEERTTCHNCNTRLPKRYLRVVNFSDQVFSVGEVLADRFVFRGPKVVLDVRPGLLLQSDYEIPGLFLPYLKLFPYRIHYSQFFTIIWVGEEDKAPILLLDDSPLIPNDLTQTLLTEGNGQKIMAPVASALPFFQAWPQARPLRQLNWVWQIARLWDAFLAQGVAQSLITPDLLRVEGPLLRLLELYNDSPESPPTLMDLGATLSQLKTLTSGTLNFLFAEICDDLCEGKITSTGVLTTRLENAMVSCRESQSLSVSLATRTDPGMVRKHNEDQCFPASGSYLPQTPESLLIVCDGVGGHDGGEVASAIAIEAVQEHLSQVILDTLAPEQIKQELITACCHANDLISERNDQEKRQERARMGTTLVMALIHDQQLYVAHIGDSRAYLVTKVGCYQLTVDDDIASREVRLGYLSYVDALRQPTSGSLVQALGMASSSTLHPTVQRFILDDECVLLLCSDGLSDYDRVEQLWQEELLPLLYRNYDLSTVSQRLITLANHLNGHDNVTVGLMHIGCGGNGMGVSRETAVKRNDIDFKTTVPNLSAEDAAWIPNETDELRTTPVGKQKLKSAHSSQPEKRVFISRLLGLMLLVGLLGGAVWAAFKYLQSSKPGSVGREGTTEPSPLDLDSEATDSEAINPEDKFEILPNQFLKVDDGGLNIRLNPPTPLDDADSPSSDATVKLPKGSILKTIAMNTPNLENNGVAVWYELELCRRPAPKPKVEDGVTAPPPIQIKQGERAWVRTIALQKQTTILTDPDIPSFGVRICNAPSGRAESAPLDNTKFQSEPE